MRLTRSNITVEADKLRELSKLLDKRDFESEFLDTRLAFQEVNHCMTQYLKWFVGCAKCSKFPDKHDDPRMRHTYIQSERVHPSLLPTQKSGRWSISKPPMVTISHPEYGVKLQSELTLPDYGQVWIGWDLDAIEAKMVACESNDTADLLCFQPIWCTVCGHAHDDKTATSLLVSGSIGGGRLLQPSEEMEQQEVRYVTRLTDDRQGCSSTSSGDNEGSNLRTSEAAGKEIGLGNSYSRTESNRLGSKVKTIDERTSKITNKQGFEETSEERSQTIEEMGCKTCGCLGGPTGPADIHTLTSCRMLKDELPKNIVNPHTSPEDTEWRAARNWQGKDDKRRGLAKVRYCVLYGRDHRAAEDSAYAAEYVKQGGNRAELVEAARLFLKSKPNLVACKKKWWATYGRSNEARTFLGRRRRLFGDEWSRQKEGWNHRIQGGVTDIINIAIIEILSKHPHWWLIYPSHDAAKISLPLSEYAQHPEQIVRDFKMAAEKMWTINGHTFKSTASWYIRYSSGKKEPL